jgi:hypothetical protein
MYLEILSKTVEAYLMPEQKAIPKIEIKLTPFIYKTLQLELNSIIKFNTEVPIEEVKIIEIKIYGRTISIMNTNELDAKFEIELVKALANKGTIT